MGLDRPLSTLELTALGIVMKRGPCLAHAVLKEFAESRTSAYRSGAGSIYPLLGRLADAGFLLLEGRFYSLTELGRDALRAWLRGSSDPSEISSCLDELRSRVYFLKLLSPEEATAFARTSLEGLHGLRERCEATVEEYRESGDRFSEIAMLGAVRETEARIRWMEELLARLSSGDLWERTA